MKKFFSAIALLLVPAYSFAASSDCVYFGEVPFSFDMTYSLDWNATSWMPYMGAAFPTLSFNGWDLSESLPSAFDTNATPYLGSYWFPAHSGSWSYSGWYLTSPHYSVPASSTELPSNLTVTLWNAPTVHHNIGLVCQFVPETSTGNVVTSLINQASRKTIDGTQGLISWPVGQVVIGFAAIALLLSLIMYVRKTTSGSKG